MYSLLKWTCLICLSLMVLSAAGQSHQKLIERAHKIAEQGDPYTALDQLEKAYHKDKDNLHLLNELAEFYLLTRDYASARDAYQKLYEKRPGEFPLAQLHYGQALIRTGEYQQAQSILEDFSKNYRGPNNYENRSKAKDALEGVELALKLQKDTTNITITHLGNEINSAYTDLSPVWYTENTMLYAALRVDSIIQYDPSVDKLEAQVKFYEAEKRNGWEFKGESDLPFNDPEYVTGNGALSPDGREFYFTRCETVEGKPLCRIFKSEKENGQWQSAEPLDEQINLEDYTATQPWPTVHPRTGKRMLYFVSDRPRSRGGYDIWVSQYDERLEMWRRPSNAGRYVNTEGDEMTPFYVEEEKQLYFSSDGWPSVGGMDIFKVRGYSSRFSGKPQNLGFPINSSADDLYFTKVDSLLSGLVVSNRKGGIALKNPTCCDDIYEVNFPPPIRPVLEGQIVSTDTNNPEIPFASIALIDLGRGDTIMVDSTDDQGHYQLTLEPDNQYQVIASKPDYLDVTSDSISTVGITSSKTLDAPRMKMQPLTKDAIVIKNIYYEFDSTRLTESSKTVLDTTVYKLLQDNPGLKIEIMSHTDSKGSNAYNERLSQGRAQSVVNYLVSRGIEKERLAAKGYGEEQPIAPNNKPDGSDNPEGRAKNRRTEFRIIDFHREDTEVIYKE